MILRVNTSSSLPVYAQLVEQVKRAIATGVIRPSDPLPSLRETSVKLKINPLTVGKAYKLLESEGLIETKHGLGSYVAGNAVSLTQDFRRGALEDEADLLIEDAYRLGVGMDELRQLLSNRIEAIGQTPRTEAGGEGNEH